MELAYDRVELSMPKRSKFDLSFDRKFSFDMGLAYPMLVQECVPGDTWHIQASDIIRFQPLISPVYHRLDFKIHYFFVPNRLVWNNWENFITQKDPDINVPTTTMKKLGNVGNVFGVNQLTDYFDLPVDGSDARYNEMPLCVLPFRAYNLIYNEYFRDEFKQNERPIFKESDVVTDNELSYYDLYRVGWEKDYFTNAQHHPQQGAAVTIPLKNNTSIGGLSIKRDGYNSNNSADVVVNSSGNLVSQLNGSNIGSGWSLSKSNANFVSAGTIHELYTATAIQRFRDKLQLGGGRYIETLLSLFGVTAPDYRLQRPEYIGGSSHPIEIGRILQTSESSGNSPLGSYAGEASGTGKSPTFDYYCEEHGYIIGIAYVVPRTGYQQGIPRKYIKRDIYDWYFPDFALLGDQEVLNDEIYAGTGSDNGIFGYNPRYSEYKYNDDKVNGDFRTTLSFWHMNRIFDSLPSLNSQFIECVPTQRIFAVEDNSTNRMYAELYQDITAIRPMPTYVLPQIAE
mgnify:CR=1 FL=1